MACRLRRQRWATRSTPAGSSTPRLSPVAEGRAGGVGADREAQGPLDQERADRLRPDQDQRRTEVPRLGGSAPPASLPVRYQERSPAVSPKSKKNRAARMILELRSLGCRVEYLGAYSSVRLHFRPLRVLVHEAGRAADLEESPRHTCYGRASYTRLNGVSAARRKRVNPALDTTSRIRFSPACAPNAAPTSWASDAGVQIIVEAE